MADSVSIIMERMVPDLQDLETNGLFTHKEISSIIRKRRTMEYILHGSGRKLSDYVAAVEYEINLESLHQLRKKRLGVNKGLVSDFSIQHRLFFIFERMVQKYYGDVSVWLKYVQYCESINANGKLALLYPRILQLHPREEKIWLKAANWEMAQGNFNNARTLLQRCLRINKKRSTVWKEYFRFELTYINIIEERRKVLGLRSLRDILLPEDDTDVSKVFQVVEEKVEEIGKVNERDDISLLEEEENELPEPKEKNAEIDAMIGETTEEAQRSFLMGAIPKSVYQYAIEDCGEDEVCVSFLEASYELNNHHVEEYILSDIIQNHNESLSIWSSLLEYPLSCVLGSMKEEEEASQKKRSKTEMEDTIQITLTLASKAKECLASLPPVRTVEMILRSLNRVMKSVVSWNGSAEGVLQYEEQLYRECENKNGAVILEMVHGYASFGDMENCINTLFDSRETLLRTVSGSMEFLKMLAAVPNAYEALLREKHGVSSLRQFICETYSLCIEKHRSHATKEELLALQLQDLKYLMSQYVEDKSEEAEKTIHVLFRNTLQIAPELNEPVFELYLSFAASQSEATLRQTIDFALHNEVLIPQSRGLLLSFVDYEERLAAGEESPDSESVKRVEGIYDILCRRYEQDEGLWIEYLKYERQHNRIERMKQIYNRAIHSLTNLEAFEEQFLLLKVRGSL